MQSIERINDQHFKNRPRVALTRLDELSWGVIVGDVEPESMRDGSWSSFPHAEGVSTDEISTVSVGVIQGVEKEWCGWSEQILNVL